MSNNPFDNLKLKKEAIFVWDNSVLKIGEYAGIPLKEGAIVRIQKKYAGINKLAVIAERQNKQSTNIKTDSNENIFNFYPSDIFTFNLWTESNY